MSILNKILLILLPLTNWLFVLQINKLFANEFSYEIAIWTLIEFLLWGTILCLNLVLVKKYIFLISSFSIGIISFFITGINIYIFGGIILLFLSFLYAKKNVKLDLENLIKIDFFKALYRNLWFFVVIVSLLVSITYFISPKLSNYKLDLTIPEKTFNIVFSFIDIAPDGLMGFDFGIADLKDNFKKEVYTTANNYLNKLVKPYEVYIPSVLALALFFGLQILNWPVRFLLSIITSIIVRILISVGVVKKTIIKVDKEELSA